jgi:hypothetical protein
LGGWGKRERKPRPRAPLFTSSSDNPKKEHLRDVHGPGVFRGNVDFDLGKKAREEVERKVGEDEGRAMPLKSFAIGSYTRIELSVWQVEGRDGYTKLATTITKYQFIPNQQRDGGTWYRRDSFYLRDLVYLGILLKRTLEWLLERDPDAILLIKVLGKSVFRYFSYLRTTPDEDSLRPTSHRVFVSNMEREKVDALNPEYPYPTKPVNKTGEDNGPLEDDTERKDSQEIPGEGPTKTPEDPI